MLDTTNINQLVVIIFTVIMLVAFFHALASYYLKNNPQAVSFYASTLTSLGILGTFTGIALGILFFDTHVIDDSLILMIQGFKTAFVTSIIGLTLSILLKQITFLLPNKTVSKNPSAYSLLENVLTKQTDALHAFQENTAEKIVQGLDKVVVRFNEKIDQQFGQNLKGVSSSFEQVNANITTLNKNILGFEEHINALNLAVESSENIYAKSASSLKDLVEKVAQTQAQLKSIELKTDLNDQHFTQVNKSSEQLMHAAQQLNTQFEQFNQQLQDAALKNESHHKALSDALNTHMQNSQETFIDAFNTASKQEVNANKALLTQLESASKAQASLVSQIDKTLEVQSKANESAINKATSLSEQVEAIAHTNENFIEKATNRLTREFESITAKQYSIFKNAHDRVQTSIEGALNQHDLKHEALLKQHYVQFEKQLNNEMQNSLEQLSKIMGFVSGEFARDFQQLIDQMQSVKSELSEQVIENHA